MNLFRNNADKKSEKNCYVSNLPSSIYLCCLDSGKCNKINMQYPSFVLWNTSQASSTTMEVRIHLKGTVMYFTLSPPRPPPQSTTYSLSNAQ